MGVRGPQPQEGALRRTGWRPPYIQGAYQDLTFTMFKRSEFKDASTREVIEAALRAFATEDELDQVDLPENTMTTATLISFEEFETLVEPLGRRIVCRNYLKEQPNRSDLPAYEFQDNDPGVYGSLGRDGTWEVCFNGGKGTGFTLDAAYAAMKTDYDERCIEQGII
jgi:hypothetical protein